MQFWKPTIFLMVVVPIPDIHGIYDKYIYMYICLNMRDYFQAANRNIA